jgi:hypothetical protein
MPHQLYVCMNLCMFVCMFACICVCFMYMCGFFMYVFGRRWLLKAIHIHAYTHACVCACLALSKLKYGHNTRAKYTRALRCMCVCLQVCISIYSCIQHQVSVYQVPVYPQVYTESIRPCLASAPHNTDSPSLW